MKHQHYVSFSSFFVLLWMIGSFFHSSKAQIWGLPCGSSLGGSHAYLTTATTIGKGVYIPLDYLNSSMNTRYFIMYESEEPLTVIRGEQFDLSLIAKSGGPESQTTTVSDLRTTCAFIYSDWNCDGVFEDVCQVGTAHALGTPQGNMDVLNIKCPILVPSDAKIGKTRLRVRYTQPNEGVLEVGAMQDVTKGLMFDISVYVIEPREQQDFKIVVKSNSILSGSVEVMTPTKDNGRYDKDTKVKLKASVNDLDQQFISWTIADEVVSTDSVYEFTASRSVMLVANFTSPLPELVLSAPEVSSLNNPIWYQIMNAQSDNRKDMCISNDGFVFKCLKPADGSSQFLWRIEAVDDNLVKFVSKKDGRCMSVAGSVVDLKLYEDGATFVVSPSGNANGSYSIKYNNDASKLLNCDGSTNSLVLFNGGVGTGSGWYFYKANFASPSDVKEENYNQLFVWFEDQLLWVRGGIIGSQVRVYNISGNCVQIIPINDDNRPLEFSHPKGCYLIQILEPNGSKHTFKTIL